MTSLANVAVTCLILANAWDLIGASAVHSSGAKLSASEMFSKSKFSPCKGTRNSNPVEIVKAHVFATKLFNEIGIRPMIKFAVDYQVPAYAIYEMGDMACLLHLLWYADLSKNGSMMLPIKLPPETYTNFLKRYYFFMVKAFPNQITVRTHQGSYTIPWDAVAFLFKNLPPFIVKVGDGHLPRDVNFILHTVDYFRRVFL